MFVLFLIFFVIKAKDNNNNVCQLNLEDINVVEFFSNFVWERALNKTFSYKFQSSKNRGILKNILYSKKDCDVFELENSKINIKFGRNPKKILEFLKVFNIRELGYYTEFLELVQGLFFDIPEGKNGSLSLRKLWKFYFDVNWDQDKYSRIYYPQFVSTEVSLGNETLPGKNEKNFRFDWKEWASYILGGNRTLDAGAEIRAIHDESLSKMNIFVILSKRASDIRKQFKEKPINIENRTRPYTIFEYLSESFGEYFGFYGKDEEGRIAFNYFDYLVLPFIGQLFSNITFIRQLNRETSKAIESFTYQEVRLVSLLKYVYTGVTSDPKWSRLKNTFYNTIYSRQTKYKIIILRNMFKSPFMRSLEFWRDFAFSDRGIYIIQEHLNLLKYSYNSFENKKSHFISYENIYDYIPHPDLRRNSIKTRRFLYIPYYEGNKYYNLPEYGSDEEWILSIFDVFDPRFWAISASWFTGFHPDDRRKIRPFGFFGIIPSDFFSLTQWVWRWVLRSNVTRTFLPFLDDSYELPNEEACLPAFPRLPDPAYGCAYPTWEFVPPIFPRENYTDLFRIEFTDLFIPYLPFCVPYRNPFRTFVYIVQAILTVSLGPILEENPAIGTISDFLEDYTGIGLILNVTGGEGSDALPVGLWQCVLPQVPFLTLLAFIFIALFSVWFFSCLSYCRDTIVASEGMGHANDIDDLKHALYENEQVKKLIGYLALYNLSRIEKLEKGK